MLLPVTRLVIRIGSTAILCFNFFYAATHTFIFVPWVAYAELGLLLAICPMCLGLAVTSAWSLRSSDYVYAIWDVLLSICAFISAFAIIYLFVSTIDPQFAFSTKAPLSMVQAVYFSVVTFATVGYGDITPTRDLTRGLVTIEIVFAMLFAVLVFSIVASVVADARIGKRRR